MNGSTSRLSQWGDALIAVADLCVIYLACLFWHVTLVGTTAMEPRFLMATLGAMLTARVVFSFTVYENWRGRPLFEEVRALAVSWLTVVLLIATFAFLTKTGASISRLWFGVAISTAFVCQVAVRIFLRLMLRRARARGFNHRSIIVLGAGSLGEAISRNLAENPAVGLNIVGYFDDDPDKLGKRINGVPVRGTLDDAFRFVEQRREAGHYIDQVWFALPIRSEKRTLAISKALGNTAARLHFVPSMFGARLLGASAHIVADIPLIDMSGIARNNESPPSKVLLDYTLATGILLFAWPLMLLIALLIKLESPGPVLFKQRRYGLHGQIVLVWKFRTMTVLENGEAVAQAIRNDARVTRLGRLLRKTSLDELPQFFNVLQGRMSIVGPRPHAVAHNEQYRMRIENYMHRHRIKPGITGLAQVSGFRGETDTDAKMQGRVDRDLAYMSNWSIWLDLDIIARTVKEVFGSRSAY